MVVFVYITLFCYHKYYLLAVTMAMLDQHMPGGLTVILLHTGREYCHFCPI